MARQIDEFRYGRVFVILEQTAPDSFDVRVLRDRKQVDGERGIGTETRARQRHRSYCAKASRGDYDPKGSK